MTITPTRLKRLIPAVLILILALLPLLFLKPAAPSNPEPAGAYDFFSSFLPADELTEGENGSLLWNGTELLFARELAFPNGHDTHSTATGFPRQNAYTITPTGAEGLILNVSVTNEQGERLLPGDTASVIHDLDDHKAFSRAELYSLRLRLLAWYAGAWYTVCDDAGYNWEGGQQGVRLFPSAAEQDVIYPLPTGSYALALCDEAGACYGVAGFFLVNETTDDCAPIWDGIRQQTLPRPQALRQLPFVYRVEDLQATQYCEPFIGTN